MKKLNKPVVMTALATTILAGSVAPSYAASNDEFDVKLSSYNVEEPTSVEFEIDIDDDDYFLMEGKELKVTFPKEFDLPKKIKEEHVLINGEEAEDVDVYKDVVTITLPDDVDGDDELSVEFLKDANIINPDDDDDEYTIQVDVSLGEEILGQDGKKTTQVVEKTYVSDEFEIVKKPKETPKPQEPQKPAFTTKTLEVGLEIGSNLAFQKSAVNDKESSKVLTLETSPYIKDGSTLVPLRFVAEGLGLEVSYDGATKSALFSVDGTPVKLTVGSKTAFVGGQVVTLPVAPELKNGRMMVPLRFVSETFGADVEWNGQYETIKITKTTVEKSL